MTVSEKSGKRKNVSEIPTFQTISQVLTVPAWLWLNANHFRNFRSDGLSQDKSR